MNNTLPCCLLTRGMPPYEALRRGKPSTTIQKITATAGGVLEAAGYLVINTTALTSWLKFLSACVIEDKTVVEGLAKILYYDGIYWGCGWLLVFSGFMLQRNVKPFKRP